MPWKEIGVVESRMEAVIRHKEGERVSALSREYGGSRQTIHKWIRRYDDEGACGLFDRSRRPHRSPKRISEELEQRIIELREKRTRWVRQVAVAGFPDAVEIRDDGLGLHGDHRNRVFGPYYRSAVVRGQAPSTGLGLSVAHSLARSMDGAVVRSCLIWRTAFRQARRNCPW